MKLKTAPLFIVAISLLLASASIVRASGNDPAAAPQPAQPAQAPQEISPPETSQLQDFKLITDQDGWLLANGSLFWSADGGRSWQNITPPLDQMTYIQGVYFLDDAQTGWAALTTLNPSGDIQYSIAKTSDQGASWQVMPAGLFASGDPDGVSSGMFLQFLDPNNGFLVVRRATSSNFQVGTLFHTSDGGASWQRLWIPIGEPVSFVTNEKGWVAGGVTGDELYETTDGGNSWQRRDVGGGQGRNLYRLPVFENENSGILPVVVKQGTTSQVDAYMTEDGGATWQLSASVPVNREVNSGKEIPLSAQKNRHWTVVVPHGQKTLRSSPGKSVDSLSNAGPGSDAIDQLDMATDTTGWATTSAGNCSGTSSFDLLNPDPIGITCTSQVNLLLTEDGGATWQALPLPLSGAKAMLSSGYKSELYAGQGFDSCSMPTTTLMQDWAANSPYRVWNLYIGGSSRAGCGTLTSSYVQQLASMGWRFIPTWVGPQAACTSFSTRMSYDANTAYAQGRQEADKAIDTAASLGLTNADKTGAIIYYDLEFFNTTNASCKAAAIAFMNGWTGRLHERGNQAGVYGSPCSSAVPDFANNSNKLDAVWLAVWLSPNQYRANVSLSTMACISSTLWPTHQRMRQYSGSHRESWGSFSLGSIDTNVIDAPVVELGRNTACPQSGGATLYWNTGFNCANSSGDAGYRQLTKPGLQNVNDGAFNDKASSLRVPSGWSVMLYENANQSGGSACFSTDASDLSTKGNFDGTNMPVAGNVSSMKVFDNTDCNSNPPPEPALGYWNTTYYLGTQFGTQCSVTTEPGPFLFKDWGALAPTSSCRTDNWSARFTNTVHFQTGTYTFAVGSDDWARIKIGTEVVLDNWQGKDQHSATRQMTEGDYAVTVEYAETTGDARLAAWWTGPGFVAPREARDPNQWYAQYWGNISEWWDPIVQVNEGTGALDHQWGFNSPGYGLPVDRFSARYQRQVNFGCGTYIFHIQADDGVRFAVDGQVLLDKWLDQSAKFDVPVKLTAGAHELTVDYYDGSQAAALQLNWDQQSSCSGPTPTKTFTPTRTATNLPATPTRTPTNPPAAPTRTATNPPAAPTRTPTNPPAAPTRTATNPPAAPTATPNGSQWTSFFSDSFESGNFSAWTSSVTDGGDLSVSTNGAMDGSRAMNVRINDNHYIYSIYRDPTPEKTYKAFFRYDPNSISMASGDIFALFNGYTSAGDEVLNFRTRRYGGVYQLQARAKDNSGHWVESGWYTISDIPHRVEIEWKSSDPYAGNGYLLLSLDDAVNIGKLTGIANGAISISEVRLGAPNGLDSGTRGTVIFDNFIASRQTGTGAPSATNTPVAAPTRTATNPPATPTRTATKPPAATNTPIAAPTRTATNPPAAPTATPNGSQWTSFFSDSFESGNFSAWTSSVTDGGDLSVSTNGAMDGSRAMNARINDNHYIYSIYRDPTPEKTYKAFFRYDPNSISMASGDIFALFNGYTSAGDEVLNFRTRWYGGVYQLQARAKDNSGHWVESGWYTISDIPHRVEIEWKSSDPYAGNGYLLLSLDNAVNIGKLTGIANGAISISEVRMGAPNGLDSGTRGTVIFDNFIASRQTSLGGPISVPTTAPTLVPTKPQVTATATNPPAAPTRTATNPPSAPTATPGGSQWTNFFSDSFELGNFSAWTSSVTDGGDLSVSTNGAMDGSRAMNARINDNHYIYSIYRDPTPEKTYKAFFRYDPNSISMASGDIFALFNGYTSAGDEVLNFRTRRYGGVYQLQARAKDNSGHWVESGWYTISDIPHRVEIEWKSSDPYAGNGYLLLSLDNAVNIGNLTGIANGAISISEVRLGAPNGLDSGTRGTVIFDNFIASRIAQ